MPKGPQGQETHAHRAHRIFTRLPLRLEGLVLCIVVLVPVMFVATKFFPPEERGTVLVASCFVVAALYAFFGMGGRKRAKRA
jgi:hypothetical protein